MKSGHLSYLLKIIILAMLYFGAAKVGLLFSFVEGNVTLVWPPTGIALAALLLFGYRLWPGVALGTFLATASTGAPLGFVLATAIGNPLEALAGAYLLRRVGFNYALARVQDVVNLIFLGAGLSPILSAAIGVASLCLSGMAPWPAYGSTWWSWWLGDAMGVLLMAPVLLTWATPPNPLDKWSSRQKLEAGAALLAGLTAGLIVFSNWAVVNRLYLAFIYLPFPVLLWAALRFGPPGAATMNLAVNIAAVLGIVLGHNPFSRATLNENLFLLWTSMGIAMVTALVTAAITAERQQAKDTLQESQDQLAGIIDSAMDAIITVDETQHIVLFNAAAEQMFGYSAADVIGQSHERLLPERFRTAHWQHIHRFSLETGSSNRNLSLLGPLWALRADGQEFPVEISISRVNVAGQRLYTAILRDITEKLRTEESLRQSEERFRSALDNMLEGCQIIGFDWRYRYVNQAVATHGKQPKEALLGHTMMEVYPGIEQTAVFAVLRRCMNERVATQMDNEFVFPDGSRGWFELRIQPVPEGIFILSFDITKRKQAEKAFRESEEKLRLFIEHAPAALAMFDCEMRYLARSRRWMTDYGLEGRDIIGQSHYDIFPEIPDRWKAVHRRGLAGEVVQADEDYFVRVDGAVQWLHWEVRPWYATDGSIGGIVIFTEDITERKQAEDALRQSEARYRAIVDDQTELLCRYTPDYILTFVNEAYCRFFGRPSEELVGQNLLQFIPPENHQQVYDQFTRLTPENPIASHELSDLKADGTLRWLHWTDRGIFSKAGQLIEVQAVGQEITERKQLEAQLLQSQKMEAIGRLAGGIAHDFNNILVPIIGYVELGMLKLSPDDKLYPNLKQVREAAERAADLTRQILAFSRKQVLEMQVLDLNGVVADFKKMIQRLIGEDIELQTFLDPALYRVNADKGQIEQVLLNLVVNARDAMPTGGKLTIETANAYLDEAYVKKYADVQLPGHYVMLAVSDTGHGMDAETQQQIFDPFFTTKEHGKGTGLGLATVFGIVKQHEGYIWIYSEPGQGATFKIYLPQAEDTGQTPETTATLEPAPLYGAETVLVVEDEEMVRRLVCETLTAHGYNVLEAQNPNDGLNFASEYKPIHLLLTDVIMPGTNGRELYQKVTVLHPDIKVLYMSGYTDNVIVHHGVLDGGVNFLQKPFTVQSLTQKVRQVLN